MRLILVAFATLQFSGCLVTGGIEYQDPNRPEVKANLAFSREVKAKRPRTDKNVVELETSKTQP